MNGHKITYQNANNSKIMSGTISGAVAVDGAGTGNSFDTVTFSGALDNQVTGRTYANCVYSSSVTNTAGNSTYNGNM